MRRYDDPVTVSQGVVTHGVAAGQEGPVHFVWRECFWQVREVVAHWVETGAWWRATDGAGLDLLGERETWRVVARRTAATGVFDLRFDWSEGSWRLIGCVD